MRALEQAIGMIVGLVVGVWLLRQMYDVLSFCPVP